MARLIVDTWKSYCGACGKNADPYAERHDVILGYTPAEGCHAEFTEVGTHYVDFEGLHDRIKAMRPDLDFVGTVA